MDSEPDYREVFRELKYRLEQELPPEKLMRCAPTSIWLKLIFLCALLSLGYIGILWSPPGLLWLLLWAGVGVTAFFVLVCAAHDASHGVLSSSWIVNRIIFVGSFALFGIDGDLWALRHRAAHHAHTNVSNVDPDSSPNLFLRLSPHHPWRPWFRFQVWYALLLYPFALAHTMLIQDFEHLLCAPLPYVDKISSRPRALLRAVLIKVAYVSIFVLVPWCLYHIPLKWVMAGVGMQFGVASLVFVLTICLNHYVTETTFYDLGAHPVERSHLLHQLRSSADWYPTSPFWCGVMGGANAHTAHHLFPSISHAYYPTVSRIIREVTTKYGLPYNCFTFMEGLRSHFTFLSRLSRREE